MKTFIVLRTDFTTGAKIKAEKYLINIGTQCPPAVQFWVGDHVVAEFPIHSTAGWYDHSAEA